MATSVIMLNDNKTTAFIPGGDGRAVAVLREAHRGRVVVYNSKEEFLKAEKAPDGISPWLVDLAEVHPHILAQFVRELQSDPRFADAVKQLKAALPVSPSSWAVSRVDAAGLHQDAVAADGAQVIQRRGDAVVLPHHWFYAR